MHKASRKSSPQPRVRCLKKGMARVRRKFTPSGSERPGQGQELATRRRNNAALERKELLLALLLPVVFVTAALGHRDMLHDLADAFVQRGNASTLLLAVSLAVVGRNFQVGSRAGRDGTRSLWSCDP